jgi:putative ABC transport system permease protein
MFWKMVSGALARQKRKHLMIAFTVGLGVSLATAMLGVMFDVGDKVNQELKSYGANLNVLPRGASLLSDKYRLADVEGEGEAGQATESRFIDEAELYKIKMIFWAYNIVDYAPFLSTRVHSGETAFDLVGTWFEKHLTLPTGDEVDTGVIPMKSWWKIEGEPGSERAPEGVMVGKKLAAKLGLAPGSAFAARSPDGKTQKTLKVRSVFSSGDEDENKIYAPLPLAQEFSGQPGRVQRVEVSALTTPENDLARRASRDPGSLSRQEWDTWYCTAYISSIAYQIEEIMPGVQVKAIMRVAESEGGILEKTQLMIVLLTLLTLLCSALAISNLVTANIMERSVEIGLMKALGATNLSISLLVLCEMLAVAFVGGAAGYAVGLGLSQFIGLSVFGSTVAVKTVVIPIAVLMIFLVTLLGSLPALRSLLNLRPAEVLHGR